MASVEPYETKSGNRYLVRFRTPDRKLSMKRGFRTKKEAQAFAREIETSKTTGTFVNPSAGKITITGIKPLWEPGLDALAPRTKKSNLSTYRTHVEPKWGTWPVNRITTPDVRKWVSDMQAAGKKQDTIKRAIHVLKSILDVAVEAKRIPTNPVQNVKAPRQLKARRPYLTAQQVRVLAESMTTANDTAIIYTLAYCGHRINELAALNVGDFLRESNRFSITKAVKDYSVIGPTKTYETRSTPAPGFLLPKILELVEGRDDEEPLFLSHEGLRIDSGNFRARTFKDGVEAAKAEIQRLQTEEGKTVPDLPDNLTPHALRHTCASLAISVGANVKAVQGLLGHKSAAVTLDTYSDLFPDDLNDVADALNVLYEDSQ